MMSPEKWYNRRENWTWNLGCEGKERQGLRQKKGKEVWVQRSGAWAKALLILLALSVTASEDTVGLMMYGCFIPCRCSRGHESGSQAVRHHRGLELRCQYSRGRAALWTPVHHYSTERWAIQQKTGYSSACRPVWAFLPVKLTKWMLVIPNTRHRCSFWRPLLRMCEFL